MEGWSVVSQVTLCLILGGMGLLTLLIFGWQLMVLRGRAMPNCDGSHDDWHGQKTHFGIAFADVFVACPVTLAGIALVFIAPRWGHYLLTLSGFWWIWANVMTTATSLRFEKPKITFMWFLTYPFGALLGLAYVAWTVVHFDYIRGL